MSSRDSTVRRAVVLWGNFGDRQSPESLERLWPGADLYRAGTESLAGVATLADDTSFKTALRAAREQLSECDCLFVRAGVNPPPLAAERLHRGLTEIPQAVVASPLGNGSASFWPLPEPEPGQPAAAIEWPAAGVLDRAAALCRPARVMETGEACPDFSVWRLSGLSDAPLETAALMHWLKSSGSAASSLPRALVCGDVYVETAASTPRYQSSDPRDRPAPAGLAPLRAQLAEIVQAVRDLQALPSAGMAPRPVCLHVLHCWGGGIAQWTGSVTQHWQDYESLSLVAWSNPGSDLRGQELRLHAGAADGPLLARWSLPRPIRATDTANHGYRQVLEWVIEHFAVDALCVSSLIGHSLEVLDQGLPTLYVFHDYYPLWPDLGLCFENPALSFARENLSQALQRGFFSGVTADDWLAVRKGLLERLKGPGVRCLAPSRSVTENLPRIDPEFAALEIEVAAHGLVPLGDRLPAAELETGQRLRLLVPGRIPPSKGRDLLLAALPQITQFADVYLVGASRDGQEFFGQSHVHVVLEYRRETLADMIATVRPHAAMLLSTVSETFNLTLSEMWSLGLPVLATRVGALAERIEHGVTGWLTDADPDALAAAVRFLVEHPEQVTRVAASPKPATTMEQAVARYAKLLPAPEVGSLRYPLTRAGVAEMARAATERQRFESVVRVRHLESKLEAQRDELDRRARWAEDESRKARERLEWAQGLELELETVREAFDQRGAQIEALDLQLDERTRWAQALQSELDDRDRHIQALSAHTESVEARLLTVVNSRSWRLTRPMRGAARLLRDLLMKLGMQTRRASSAAQRTRKSLKTRGLGGTVERIGRELKRGEPELVEPLDVQAPTRDFEPLTIAPSSTPEVSIVIPAYGHYEHTHACLKSLIAARCDGQFEVIVVDDASPDAETAHWLAQHEGITVLTNEENLGFIATCNRGAQAAQGEFLVFLNNDTTVTDHWLDRLLEPFTDLPDAGLVGARLVYPDGRLQEAGGIIFSDGSGWNYGRFENPNAPQFSFLREVDYCSGAAIMLRRELFDEIGGFDRRYRPAYYEDVDLAFEVRARGLRVMYQPTATVVHFEGVSSGTDTTQGTKRFQPINQQKLVEKWSDELARHPAPETPLDVSRRHRRPRSILVIDACTPRPDHDAGSLRMMNLMQILMDLGWHVRFMADNRAFDEDYTPDLQAMGIEALYHPFLKSPERWLKDHGKFLDAVLVSRHYVARNYVEMFRRYCPDAQLIFDTVDLHYLREQRQAQLEDDPGLAETARRTRARELDVARRSDLTLVVSEFEKQFLADDAPDVAVGVLSTIVSVAGCRRPFGERKDLLFVGGFQHPPNEDAVKWFAAEVMPLLAKELPDVRLHVIGSRATEPVRALASEHIQIHGFVPDIEPWLDGCRLSLAPLRFGAGVKGKINTAMAYGQPVVATPTAVEGMHVTPGVDVMVGATAREFADAVVAVYRDEALWGRLSQGGLKNVEEHFSFKAARRALSKILPSD